jgi:small-conductance mechanosensitive channel
MKLMELLHDYGLTLMSPALIIVVILAIGLLVRRLLFSALARWAQKTSGQWDDIIVRALRGPFIIWVLMLAIHLASQVSSLPDKISNSIGKILVFLFIVSLTVVGSKIAGEAVKAYGTRTQGTLPVTSLTQNVAQLVVIVIGLLILLDSLRISITPLLTALGVGGLAVALGLQDTLANFFAGVHVSLAGNVRLGDYIKLGTGEEGYVSDITWRTTTVRALSNNLIIIPNSKLAQAIVINYHLPEKRLGMSITVPVSYDSDLDLVERILLEEAQKGAQEIEGLLADPAPSVRFIPGFGNSSLDFTLGCQVSEFVYQYPVQHELRKRILMRFRRENIQIPYPTRTVYLNEPPAKPRA